MILLPYELDVEIFGGLILSPHNRYRPFIGSVGISGENIKYVCESRRDVSAKTQVDASGKIVMPGLINGHCHGDMTLARGLGDDLTLGEQNKAFEGNGWFYRYITDEDRYFSRQLAYCEALRFGTTFILENMYWGLGQDSVKAMAQTGIKGGLAQDIRPDFAKPDNLMHERTLRDFAEDCRSHGIVPIIGSVSEEDFEPERLQRISSLASSFGLMQTFHMSETQWRQAIVLEKYQGTSATLLKKWGVLSDNMICSHAVYVSEDEIKLMADAGVKVVNTPLCEMKIADGIAPIPGYLRAGVSVGLGTDGAMWNNSNDIFREMKGMVLLHTINSGIRTLSAHDVLDMATIKGAAVFGQEGRVGSLEPGKSADIILIDATGPHMTPLRLGRYENVASSVVFNATGADVTDVFVNGRHVVSGGELKTVDFAAIASRVTQTSERLASKLCEEGWER